MTLRRRRDKRVWWLALVVFVAVGCFVFLKQNSKEINNGVQAASLANFDAGYIISDYQMGNYESMSEKEIQDFLTSKNPCNNQDYDYYLALSANSSSKWHFEDGHFVCLSEEKFGDSEVIGSGETAAHIIWQAAQDYRINPQVLIVLLQKETGLITDPIPNDWDYRRATGYGCPDTAACSEKYYGFKNQIRNAAAMFRAVLDGGWTNYPLGDNYIQYNPSASCGGSVVNVKNLATSALYRYTPYQPNAATLAAGYGTATCGAYGNRNFYLYFEDWFGGITNAQSEVDKEYLRLGGGKSNLGKAISDEICGLTKSGCYRSYEKGYIYWTEATGAHEIMDGIFGAWFNQGTEWGPLGYPKANEQMGSEGIYQEFEGGTVYEISGVYYVVLNYAKGIWEKEGLGKNIDYGTCNDVKSLCWQTFENGTIYWDVKTGAWVVRDFALSKWKDLGGVNSKLRKTTNNGYCGLAKGGCYQAFETGNIYWTEKTGAWDVSGGIFEEYFKYGTEWGVLGYPTSSEQRDANGKVYQTFENGTIYWDVKTGARTELN